MGWELEPVTIYGLIDPREGLVRYVGQTIDPAQRLREHLKAGRHAAREGTGPAAALWVGRLLAAGLEPTMRALELIPQGGEIPLTGTAEALKAEQRWIVHYRPQLYNWPGRPRFPGYVRARDRRRR